MGPFFELVLYTLATLLPIVNPFSTGPLFLAITEGYDEAERNEQARRGVLYMVAILGVFLLAGTLIIKAFGISLPGVRIAGGILVGRVAFRMLYPQDRAGLTPEEEKESRAKTDISFFPLAMPSLSGPGSIAATISLATTVQRWWDYIAISFGILLIAVIIYFSLRLSGRLTQFLGVSGTNAMTKIMGFIIFCVAVQFIVNGVTDPSLVAKFHGVPEPVCP